ncbi:MAG: putative DNA-binding domain-containing protein [Planctomycetes bacterium]|nr:putative DNA-binding domain-containing protein [Planctomycetota bacterium]
MCASPEAPAELIAQQRLLFRAISGASPEPRAEATGLLATPPRGGARERVELYRRMFLLRAEEALGDDLPILMGSFEAGGFARFVARYLEHCPSRSWTLADLGRALPRFLADPLACPNELLPAPWPRELLVDLARAELRFERARTARRAPALEIDALRALPPEQRSELRLALSPEHALLLTRYDLRTTLRRGRLDPLRPPRRRAMTLALRWYAGRREPMRLERSSARFLQSLRRGNTLGRALERALRLLPDGAPAAQIAEQLFALLREQAARGALALAPAHEAQR